MIWKSVFVIALAVGAMGQLMPDVQQYKNVFQSMCEKNGAPGQVQEIEKSINSFKTCVSELVNVETIKQEIEEAKPRGALDEVFKKYCAKSPQLKSCIHAVMSSVTPCLDAGTREQVAFAHNATDQLLDFVCYKDGDRIALFIAEQGPGCFQAKTTAISECANKLKSSVGDNIQTLSNLTLNEQCAKYDELTECIVKALEGCDTPTPANMAEALLKFIRKGSPCKSVVKN